MNVLSLWQGWATGRRLQGWLLWDAARRFPHIWQGQCQLAQDGPARTSCTKLAKGYSRPCDGLAIKAKRKEKQDGICYCGNCLLEKPLHILEPCFLGDSWIFPADVKEGDNFCFPLLPCTAFVFALLSCLYYPWFLNILFSSPWVLLRREVIGWLGGHLVSTHHTGTFRLKKTDVLIQVCNLSMLQSILYKVCPVNSEGSWKRDL